MILTQKEAKLWGEILTGFSQGKEYVYPYKYDDKGNVVEWWPLTDFTINKNCPTINTSGTSPLSLLDARLVKEKGKSEKGTNEIKPYWHYVSNDDLPKQENNMSEDLFIAVYNTTMDCKFVTLGAYDKSEKCFCRIVHDSDVDYEYLEDYEEVYAWKYCNDDVPSLKEKGK